MEEDKVMIPANQFKHRSSKYYTCLCDLARYKPRYTPYGVDPKEVHGEDFPGETFRVLKEKENYGNL